MADKDQQKNNSPKLTRRTFLKSVGVSSVGVAAARGSVLKQLQDKGMLGGGRIVGPDRIRITLMVNGQEVPVLIEPRTTLAEALRDYLQLTGTKIGCNRGACGACTVILNGRAISSCMTLALDAVGLPLETIEGLETGPEKLHPVQESFIEHDALQCGFCTSGMIMSAKSLLDRNSDPTMAEIKQAVSGNICRCATYPHVFKAVQAAAKKMK